MKNDLREEKPDFSLLPLDACEGVVRILMMGAKKYTRDNWRQGCDDPEAQRRIFSAIFRHLSALQRGETIDPESGESHVLHVACNAMFLAAFSETHRRRAMAKQPACPHVEDCNPADPEYRCGDCPLDEADELRLQDEVIG
jgi:hypothetical protein